MNRKAPKLETRIKSALAVLSANGITRAVAYDVASFSAGMADSNGYTVGAFLPDYLDSSNLHTETLYYGGPDIRELDAQSAVEDSLYALTTMITDENAWDTMRNM